MDTEKHAQNRLRQFPSYTGPAPAPENPKQALPWAGGTARGNRGELRSHTPRLSRMQALNQDVSPPGTGRTRPPAPSRAPQASLSPSRALPGAPAPPGLLQTVDRYGTFLRSRQRATGAEPAAWAGATAQGWHSLEPEPNTQCPGEHPTRVPGPISHSRLAVRAQGLMASRPPVPSVRAPSLGPPTADVPVTAPPPPAVFIPVGVSGWDQIKCDNEWPRDNGVTPGAPKPQKWTPPQKEGSPEAFLEEARSGLGPERSLQNRTAGRRDHGPQLDPVGCPPTP